MRKIYYLPITVLFAVFTSCSSNDDDVNFLDGTGITITDDVECCSAEEAYATYTFLQKYKEVPELSKITDDGKYKVTAYTTSGTLHKGYNDIFFVGTKVATGNYVKSISIRNFLPLMHMKASDMYHSTPTSSNINVFDYSILPVQKGWVSFVMNTSSAGDWNISYDASIVSNELSVSSKVNVDKLLDGQDWIKSFKVGDNTYHISLINPDEWSTGTNSILAYITKKSANIKEPWTIADEVYTVEIVPTMPDMGNHSSPGNESLVKQNDKKYKGTINLTMTGLWRIHLTIKDSDGNVVAGGDNLSDGYSSLYFDVTI
ncbi:MAG: FixH family protein [Bacteroidaceae bacterium]|nr:FixH family protein [Bacteroidaceae bacterium]